MVIQSETCREFLETLYTRRKRNNPRYSQRALARHLKMSPGELSEILRGIRPVTPKTARHIADTLGLSAGERHYLIRLAEQERSPDVSDPSSPGPENLPSRLFDMAGDWFCWALIALASTDDFRWDNKWISKRLGVTEPEVRIGIDKLKRVGVLIANDDGYEVRESAISFNEGVPSETMREYHQQILEKAGQALELQPPAEREFTGLTLAMDPNLLPLLKKEIAHFMQQMGERYSSGKKKTEVFHVEFAAFKLTPGRDHDS